MAGDETSGKYNLMTWLLNIITWLTINPAHYWTWLFFYHNLTLFLNLRLSPWFPNSQLVCNLCNVYIHIYIYIYIYIYILISRSFNREPGSILASVIYDWVGVCPSRIHLRVLFWCNHLLTVNRSWCVHFYK